jgi:hypothetical protein
MHLPCGLAGAVRAACFIELAALPTTLPCPPAGALANMNIAQAAALK